MDQDVSHTCKTVAIVVAGGRGSRMGGDRPKQFLTLSGVPILVRTLNVFARHPGMDTVVAVVPRDDVNGSRRDLLSPYGLDGRVTVIAGGDTRQASVMAGLDYLNLQGMSAGDIVLIHDGVRPFVSGRIIEDVIEGACRYGAAIPGIPVVDTLKRCETDGRVRHTVNRDHLFRIQTPQGFDWRMIREAYRSAQRRGIQGTDDAALLEARGVPVHIVPGDIRNLKITTPEDLERARDFMVVQDARCEDPVDPVDSGRQS